MSARSSAGAGSGARASANTGAGARASGGGSRRDIDADIRATLMPGFAGFTAPDWVLEALAAPDHGLAAVCVYGGNVRSRDQLQRLGMSLRAASPNALVAIDEEGGEVTRLHYLEGAPYPGAAVLGRIGDLDYTERIGARVGRDILASGFTLALAPDADVNSNPENPVIGTRSFSADPEVAARHAAAWVRGLQSTGALACPKHFPGHGDTAQDSHLELPVVDAPRELIERRDLPPFRAVIAAGAPAIMTSHILLPQIDPTAPATFSRDILHGLLREQLGFDGVIASDALDMRGASGAIGIPEAAVRALDAGCDLLCLGTDTTAAQFAEIEGHVRSAVRSGRLSADRVRDAADRVRALARRVPPPAAGLRSPDPDAAEIARIGTSFAGLDALRAWLAEHPRAGVIHLDTESNLAIGEAPWGPRAAVAHPLPAGREAAERFAARASLVVDLTSDAARPAGAGAISAGATGCLVIGRGIHRHEAARQYVDALRAAGAPVFVVEMGAPGSRPGYADLACFGASPLVGAALIAAIEDGSS